MPVTIGQPAAHNFDRPIGMLGDCHRRIERFLGVLVRLGATAGSKLAAGEWLALDGALAYFRESGPRHTADEEESLFPRLKTLDTAEAAEALAEIERLEADHRHVEPLHAEIDELGRRWLADDRLSAAGAQRFQQVSAELARVYAAHIQVEDTRVFPLADRALSRDQQVAIGQEMAARRKVAMVSVRSAGPSGRQ